MSLERVLAPIKQKIFLLIGKALLTAVNNEGKVGFHDSGARANPQRLTMNWYGQLTDIERSQPYGFETYPKTGTAKAVLLSPDGSRSNTFVIQVQDDTYRPTDLSEGDTCLYNAKGVKIVLENATNKLKITASGDAEFTVPNLKVTGNIEADGFITAKGDVIADDEGTKITLLTHYHVGNLGYNTGIGIVSGGTVKPAGGPLGDASGNIDMNGKDLKNVVGTDYSTHIHAQGNDSNGDSEVDTDPPS